MDFRIDVPCIASALPLIAAGLVVPYFRCGQSNIRLCRNEIAHYFKVSDYEWAYWVDSDIEFTVQDFGYLAEGEEEVVVASYARKLVGKPPVDFGFGFVKTRRSVFEKLDAWTIPNPHDDKAGEVDALHRFLVDGQLMTDYFFDGATPANGWLSEDTGFFNWVNLCPHRISIRRENRTQLGHWGRFRYGYPNQTPGLIPEENAAQ